MKHFVLKIVLAQILLMVCASIASAQRIEIFGYTNQLWRYNDTTTTGSNPEGLFQAPGFDDTVAGWKSGFPLFGNDDPGVYNGADDPFRGGLNGFATPLDRTGGRITFYFRTHFNLASAPAAGSTLFSTNYLDDSAAYYVNGVEIGRMRLPVAPTVLTWDTLGSNPPTEGIPYPITFGPEAISALHAGDNVLAVEVHQSSAGSSDAAFAMNLILINAFCVQITDSTQPLDASVLENRSFTLKAIADASPPISYQWVHDDVDIPGATAKKFTVSRAQLSDAGRYYCRVTNPVCSRNTRTNTVTVSDDTVAPQMIGAASANLTTVTVQFDEGMGPLVEDSFNWILNDEGGNPIGISDSIIVSSNRNLVTLTLAAGALAENALYTVEITTADDLAGNLTDTTLQTNFRTYTTAGCNSFFFEAFDTSAVAGNTVSILTSSPNFPNNPRDIGRLPSFDTRNPGGYVDNAHEQFGGRVRGLFVPIASGPWTFYLASDDNSQLWINPTGPSSAGKQLIASELGCCNNFLPEFSDPIEDIRNTQTSVPINLTAGQAYYIEALYKEGGGGDWLKVAAAPYGEPVPAYDQAGGNGSVTPTVIQAIGGPAGIFDSITIGSQPADTNVIAGGTAQFTVTLSQDVPACYQWKKEGVDIPGAIGPRYQFSPVIGDNNTHYSVEVSLLGGTVRTSRSALLNVFNDTQPPTVTSVAQDVIGNITVTFSEPVDMSIATNRTNYAIDGVTPASATASGNNVVLLEPGAAVAPCPASHSVVVQNVKDANGNTINPNPTTVAATLNNLLVIPINASKLWRYNDSGDELGSAWYATGYNDSAWSNGAPTLAFPGGEVIQAGFPVRTTLAGVRQTTYFRTHFNLASDPSSVTNLQLNVILDDGGVFYLNGQELTRIRMPAGPVDTNTITTAGSPSDPPQILETYNISPALLVSGDNVIAARVHQSSFTSSDEVFALGLFAQSTGCSAPRPRLTITHGGNSVTITSSGSGTIYKSSSISGPWTSVGAAPQTVTIGPGNQFFEIR